MPRQSVEASDALARYARGTQGTTVSKYLGDATIRRIIQPKFESIRFCIEWLNSQVSDNNSVGIYILLVVGHFVCHNIFYALSLGPFIPKKKKKKDLS
ncbi:hypothetical protein QJS04_geneDACA020272 [Acorus gramineus]|uniref:Uncharacterized protein n=1 Tax=Acorus gramineus TaxID=55184 RepID=A0AAV9A3M3_ACOGR|nr:hypothetical protein QJS04_geneDACA020272 [Acorus gramineus]